MLAKRQFPVLFVTGLSGAGKSTALNVFEDMRFFAVDGLPVGMAPRLAALFQGEVEAHYRGVAVGVDLRQQDFLGEWGDALAEFNALGLSPQIVFVEARPDVLRRRYATTRRPHPLEAEGLGLEQALEQERLLLDPVRSDAHMIIDTSDYSIHDLRRAIQEKWQGLEGDTPRMRIHIVTFGFKYGVPSEADLVFDMRFLPNPYFDENLRALSGKDQAVADYVLGREPGATFIARFCDFLHYLLPLYAGEGRYRVSVGIGCTGGRHRSVAVAEALFRSLKKQDYAVSLEHRHLELG
ncbi:MAG: RNase adapter RapZ [Desulfovibrionaceae bacterium]|jgi:UPF0042 nucleotide-binding protein|nr:RNase adapter RapZ [Desulfovibrionaceae bacterium]